MREDLPERRFRPGLHRFSVLAQHLPPAAPGQRWVDLGGGAGEFAALVSGLGFAVTLVDGDTRNLARVEDRDISGVEADLNEPLTLLDDRDFDGASLIEVIEHVPLAEQLLKETHRVLKPGGLLLLSTPNAAWWKDRLRMLLGRTMAAEGYHYRFFTLRSLRRLCEDSGFTVTHMRFSTPAIGYNWIARRILRKKTRKHVAVPRPLAGLLAQTIYVVGMKSS